MVQSIEVLSLTLYEMAKANKLNILKSNPKSNEDVSKNDKNI